MTKREKLLIKALLLLGAAALGILLASVALGRAGGGQSFGNGGGGGGGGGGGEGLGALIYILVRLLIILCIEYPAVGIPLTIIIVIIIIILAAKGVFSKKQVPGTSEYAYLASRGGAGPAEMLAPLKKEDPNFSRPLFLDFIQLLYVRYHEARGKGDLQPLAAYLAPGLIESQSGPKAKSGGLTAVTDIIIGSSEITGVQLGNYNKIKVLFESNLVEHYGDQKPELYVRESWTFHRKRGALSKGPEGMRALNCPGCGASAQPKLDGTCPYCARNITDPAFQWQALEMVVMEKTLRVPMMMKRRKAIVEAGTSFPTLFAPDLGTMRKTFAVKHPDFSWEAFQKKVRDIFLAVQNAWSTKHWDQARPFLTDHIFNSNRYWIEQYKKDGRTNKVEKINIELVEAVKIEKDAFYDAVTVRIWAQCLDYTIEDSTGKVLDGSDKKPRKFTEYWTLIRRVGAKTNDPDNIQTCPSCGAPLKITMAGICEYCGSHVSTGDFDWVVSAIQQDEVYQG